MWSLARRTHALVDAAGTREQKEEDGRMAHVSECTRLIGKRGRVPRISPGCGRGTKCSALKIPRCRSRMHLGTPWVCICMRTPLFLCAPTLIALATHGAAPSRQCLYLRDQTEQAAEAGSRMPAGGGGGNRRGVADASPTPTLPPKGSTAGILGAHVAGQPPFPPHLIVDNVWVASFC